MSDLQRLKGSERVRKRVSVMFGSDSIEGTQHSLFEVVSNSIDRFRKGHGNHIKIIKHKDLSYTIEDFADGLPMAWNEKEKAYNWDLALKVLYAGDNYNSNSTSIGMNGLGLTSTQYSSEYMEVKSYRDGKEYIVKFKKGRPIDYDTEEYICEDDDSLFCKEEGKRVLKVLNNTERTGTIIRYKPDLEVFTNTNISTDWINDKIKKQSMVNKGLKIDVIDEISNTIVTHYYENGIDDYIQEISNENNITNIISFSDSGKGRDRDDKSEYNYSYEIALVFNNELNKLEYYHNSSELLQGGSTAQAISTGVTNAIHDYIKNKGLYKKGEKIKFADIEDSIICVISSFSNVTSYSNQTKMSIDNKFIKDFTTESIKKNLEIYFIENPLEVEKIAKQILVNKRANDKALAVKSKYQKALSEKANSITTRPEKFVPCREKDPKRRRVIVIEGDSALNAVKLSRNPFNTAIQPLKGKMSNCLKKKLHSILKDTEIMNIYKILGCGLSYKGKKIKEFDMFDINNMDYEYLDLFMDQDADGFHLRCLLITMAYVLSPQLIEEGRLRIIESPLYRIEDYQGNEYFCYTEQERNVLVKKIKVKLEKRFKGLGSLSIDILSRTSMSDENSITTTVTINDVEECIRVLEMFMDEDSEDRKQYIYEHGDKYFDYDI